MSDLKQDENSPGSEKIDSSNIFEEFENDSELQQEVDNINKSKDKNVYYYLSSTGDVLQTIFWILFFIALVGYSYIFIQNKDNLSNSTMLDPFCKLILGDIQNKDDYCSSITYLNNEYGKDLEELKLKQTGAILDILGPVYKVNNFSKSKEVIFLSSQTENKIRVLDMLSKFDDLKSNYDTLAKDKIKCFDIDINKEGIMSMRCEAYSRGYEEKIKGFSGGENDKIGGTSITIANSFLNYIEMKSDDFAILDRQKLFNSESVIGEEVYFSQKTVFHLKLKYNSSILPL